MPSRSAGPPPRRVHRGGSSVAPGPSAACSWFHRSLMIVFGPGHSSVRGSGMTRDRPESPVVGGLGLSSAHRHAPYARQMGNPSAARSQRARSLNLALWLLAGCVACLGAVQLALVLPSAGDLWWLHLLLMVDFWVYVAAGILAWRRRPSNRMGPLIVIGGFAVYAASLANTGIPGLEVLGVIFATAVLAVTIHLLHAFPSGRLRGRASLMTVIAAYGVSLVLQSPLYLFDGAAPEPLVIADRPDLLMAGEWVQRAAGLAVAVATAVILARRLARADPAHRRVLGPLFAYGMLAVLFIPARSTVIEP